MNRWIAEFELEDGDTMPEHMDLEYKGARIDFHCKPLEQEPTKNDLGVDCISREDALMCLTGEFENREYELSELIKIFSKRIKALPSVTPQLSSELEKNSKKLEKDFGELDCISREQALDEFCIYNSYDSIGVDKVRSYLKALPSVTPQEPQSFKWCTEKE